MLFQINPNRMALRRNSLWREAWIDYAVRIPMVFLFFVLWVYGVGKRGRAYPPIRVGTPEWIYVEWALVLTLIGFTIYAYWVAMKRENTVIESLLISGNVIEIVTFPSSGRWRGLWTRKPQYLTVTFDKLSFSPSENIKKVADKGKRSYLFVKDISRPFLLEEAAFDDPAAVKAELGQICSPVDDNTMRHNEDRF